LIPVYQESRSQTPFSYKRHNDNSITKKRAKSIYQQKAPFLEQKLNVEWLSLLLGLCLLLSTPTAYSKSSATLPSQPSPRITQADIKIALYPKKHLFKAKVTLHIKGQRQKISQIYLSQMLKLTQVELKKGKKWLKIPFQRQLESLKLSLTTKATSTRLRLHYQVTFYARKNYLYRQIFCQIEPGDTYFLYGWYPTLHPFADPLTGHLLNKEHFPYTLQMEVPKGEVAITSGPLLKKKILPNKRIQYLFGPPPMNEAAIFFVSGNFKKHVYSKGKTKISFYVRSQNAAKGIPRFAGQLLKTSNFYHKLWGSPKNTPPKGPNTKPAKIKSYQNHWKIISFGGSGARGYPFSLLLDRGSGYLSPRKFPSFDRLFTNRQVLLHEIAHTWWGNAVTGIGKGSAWMNEGLANYASLRAIGALFGKKAENQAVRRHIDYFLQSKGKGGLLDPGGISQIAQRTAYTKGALVFYELEKGIGRKRLDKGLRLFFQKFRGKVARVKQLQKTLEIAAGTSLKHFFRDWIVGHGLPHIRLNSWSCTPSPTTKRTKAKGCILKIHLQNLGSIKGYARLQAIGPKGQTSAFHFVVSPNKKKVYLKKVSFLTKKLILNPDKLMLHGVRWRAALQRADRLRQSGQLRKAIPHYKNLLHAYPKNGHALYGLARSLEKLKQTKKAMQYYYRAGYHHEPKHTPYWVPAWSKYRYANLLQQTGMKKEAHKIFKKLLRSQHNPYGLHDRVRQTLRKEEKKK